MPREHGAPTQAGPSDVAMPPTPRKATATQDGSKALARIRASAADGELVAVIGTGVSVALANNTIPALSWRGLVLDGFTHGVKKGVVNDAQLAIAKAQLESSDLDDLLASVDRGEPADCLSDEAGITDSLLRGYDDVDPSFGSWLTVKREGIRRMLIRRLEAQLTEITHRPEVTKRIARALFQIDPTHEIACQKLMRACVASGNAGSALAPTNVVVAGGVLNMNNSTMNVSGNLTIGPGGTNGGTFNGNTGTVNIQGNFVLNAGGAPATRLNSGV